MVTWTLAVTATELQAGIETAFMQGAPVVDIVRTSHGFCGGFCCRVGLRVYLANGCANVAVLVTNHDGSLFPGASEASAACIACETQPLSSPVRGLPYELAIPLGESTSLENSCGPQVSWSHAAWDLGLLHGDVLKVKVSLKPLTGT